MDALHIAQFEPCAITTGEGLGLPVTEMVLEDVAYVSVPVFAGVYHTVDWLLAMDDRRLVGIQVWASPHNRPGSGEVS